MTFGNRLDKAYRKFRKRFGIAKDYRVGRFELTLSPDHQLDLWHKSERMDAPPLAEIARIAGRKYPDLAAIDIGANVGDTAALICHHLDVPVLCIEGQPVFAAYLRKNLARLPAGIEVVECLVGAPAGDVPVEQLRRHNGTAVFLPTAPQKVGGRTVRMRPLSDILRDHPRFARPRLIKIDTDGLDFEILLSSRDVIAETHPILFFEYTLDVRQDACRQSIAAISRLQELGYDRFLVYDHAGHFLRVIDGDVIGPFRDMNRYFMSQRLAGHWIIHHFDIAAFSTADADLALALRDAHRAMIDQGIRDAGLEQ
jgi:FkbM family methyltransferase